MRTLWRTAGRRLTRDILAIGVAVGLVGMSYGAIAIAAGVPAWATISMSVFVFAGGSQFLAVAMLAAGSPVAAILGGLLLNARHLPFGLAVADIMAGGGKAGHGRAGHGKAGDSEGGVPGGCSAAI